MFHVLQSSDPDPAQLQLETVVSLCQLLGGRRWDLLALLPLRPLTSPRMTQIQPWTSARAPGVERP